ncbi:uncharacterized protein [Physeter macrocephalus]|uniref:Uncharacterized protein n=1 Tax=Physeter macrocephalus TaxID=9755 RepID=A0A9W2X4R1_PHYMC|nr:uncharacterized protein LOC114484692 [Physeter catodon]
MGSTPRPPCTCPGGPADAEGVPPPSVRHTHTGERWLGHRQLPSGSGDRVEKGLPWFTFTQTPTCGASRAVRPAGEDRGSQPDSRKQADKCLRLYHRDLFLWVAPATSQITGLHRAAERAGRPSPLVQLCPDILPSSPGERFLHSRQPEGETPHSSGICRTAVGLQGRPETEQGWWDLRHENKGLPPTDSFMV